MHFDLRQPALVVSGHWNPLIFGMDWVAQNLFDFASGTTVEVLQVAMLGKPTPILFIQGVGIGCTHDRLELYSAAIDEPALTEVERTCAKVLHLLQHTPVFGIGANFAFSDKEVDAGIADALATAENFEAEFRLTDRTYQSTFDMGDGLALNLARHIGALDGVTISMNFHRDAQGAPKASEVVAGMLTANKPQALRIMSQYYGQDEFGVVKFDQVKSGENANEG